MSSPKDNINRDSVDDLQAIHKKDLYYRRAYQITLMDYEALLESQRGLCVVCKAKGNQELFVDRDRHKIIRGLLCRRCISGIGAFHRRYDLLGRALRYLRSPRTSRLLDRLNLRVRPKPLKII